MPNNSSCIDELLPPSTVQGWYPRWKAHSGGPPLEVLNVCGDRTGGVGNEHWHLGNLRKTETMVSDDLSIVLSRLVEGLKNALAEMGVPFQDHPLLLHPLGHKRVPWREKNSPPSEWIK